MPSRGLEEVFVFLEGFDFLGLAAGSVGRGEGGGRSVEESGAEDWEIE